jgi:hypothetical protein
LGAGIAVRALGFFARPGFAGSSAGVGAAAGSLTGAAASMVAEAVNRLDAARMIRHRRGYIEVVDRRGLEKLADHFYGVAEAELVRLLSHL